MRISATAAIFFQPLGGFAGLHRYMAKFLPYEFKKKGGEEL
jgi:hypothetical protein